LLMRSATKDSKTMMLLHRAFRVSPLHLKLATDSRDSDRLLAGRLINSSSLTGPLGNQVIVTRYKKE
jgi:hypothetical protein